jgi:hypothetical protein
MTTGAIERPPSTASRLALWYIETYRARVAPRLPVRCRFEPTCSQYGLEAYRKYGFLRATAKTGWRLLRCHPFRRATGIHDPP